MDGVSVVDISILVCNPSLSSRLTLFREADGWAKLGETRRFRARSC